MPTKQPSDTEAEFSNKLAERHVLETRELAALTAAQVDVALALATDDVDTLEALVTEALDGNRPEHVRRVSRAVELRLAALACAEVATGSGAPRVAGTARQRVAERLRAWRAAEAEQSRPVKRQRIHQRYEMRVNDVRAAVERAARAFGLNIK